MSRNRIAKFTSGPASKGQVKFYPLSGDSNPLKGVVLQGPDSVGASDLTLTLPAADVANGVVKSDGAGILSIDLIANANIAVGAAIALGKLATVTASRALVSDGSGVISPSAVTATELGYLSGVTSNIQTQLNSTASDAALTAHIADTSTHGTSGAIVGDTDAQTLSNKLLKADTTRIIDPSVSTKQIGFDLFSQSPLTLTTIATLGGTTQTVFIPDVPGNDTFAMLAKAQQLTNKDIDGGTASDSKRITIPKNTKSNLDGLTRKEGTVVYATDSKKVFFDDGTTLRQVGSGSGSGINYIENPDAEVNTDGWATYADAAGVAPVNGTGGSPNISFTRDTSAPLRNDADFLLSKDAANRQGQGVSYDFVIDSADVGQMLSIAFDYEGSISPTQFTSGDASDVRVWIYDKTNSQLIAPSVQTLQFAKGHFQATFPASSSSSYRLILHIATTVATAWGLKVDNVQLGPQEVIFGPAMSDWVDESSLFSFTGFGTPSAVSIFTRRVGGNLEARGYGTSGTTTSVACNIVLPSKYVLDTTKCGPTASVQEFGKLTGVDNSGPNNVYGALSNDLYWDGSNNDRLFIGNQIQSKVYQTINGNSLLNTGDKFNFHFSIPISGWSTNVVAANSSVFNISNVLVNGTRVTSTPTALGEYRTFIKNSSSQKGTDNAPSVGPSSTNGMIVYGNVKHTSAGTSGQTGRWEIFVGKNKTVKLHTYSSAGKTGQVNADFFSDATGDAHGFSTGYDPTTGLFWIDGMTNVSGAATGRTGAYAYDDDGQSGSIDSIYFDVAVAENALAVQQAPVRSEVMLYTANGFGSSSTKIRRYSSSIVSGADITYADSATLGTTLTINSDGIYSMSISDNQSGSAEGATGFSRNASGGDLTTAIYSVSPPTRLTHALVATPPAQVIMNATWTGKLSKGDIIRPHGNGNAASDNGYPQMTITKVAN